MTALGPLAGGFLIDWSWRAIFWINVPIAIAAIVLTLRARPDDTRRPAPLDYRGAVVFALGMGLTVLGLQQSSTWGWGSPATIASIAVGLALMALFVRLQLSTDHPLMQVRIFKNRAFAADNAILFLISIAFVPMFLFASLYSQISLGDDASNAGLYIGTFFFGYVIAAQWGGRILDARGAKAAVVPGCVIAAVGFYLWGSQMPDLDYSAGWWRLVVAGVGTGLVLGPVSTDALNRAPGTSYGEATGITQTARNLGATPRPGHPRHPADLAQRGQRRGPARLDRRQGRGRPDRRLAESGRQRWRIRRLIERWGSAPRRSSSRSSTRSRFPPRRSSS